MVELILPWLVSLISCVAVIVVGRIAVRRRFRFREEREVPVSGSHAGTAAIGANGARRMTAWAGGTALVVAAASAVGVSITSIGPAGLSQWSRYAFTTLPPLSGSLLVFAPLVGVAVFAGIVALRPAVQWSVSGRTREADILAEQPRALPRQLVGFASSAVALLMMTVLVGIAVQSADQGPALTVMRGGTTDEVAYPGLVYVFAVVVTVLAVAGLVVAAVVRVRTVPGPGMPALVAFDRAIRSWQTRMIALAGTAAMTLSIGVTSWAVGHSYATISRFPVIGDCRSTGPGSSICREVAVHYAQPAFAIGMSELVFGVILVAVSLTLVVVIARDIRHGIPVRLTSSTDPVPV